MYRCYSGRDLQLDINLLTSAFASTLAEAVQRTAVTEHRVYSRPQTAGMLSAQAG